MLLISKAKPSWVAMDKVREAAQAANHQFAQANLGNNYLDSSGSTRYDCLTPHHRQQAEV